MDKYKMKRFIPYILIIAIAGIGILGPIGASRAHAGIFDLNVPKLAADLGSGILTLVSQVVAISQLFLDASIKYSIEDFAKGSQSVVEEGWKICRDFVNLFFIFILLYIAIATILQLSGYGIKDLLVKVILIALLVNFSLLITRVIIDSSNVVAMEFYTTITTKIKPVDQQGQPVNTTGPISLSAALVRGINPQSLFKIDENNVGILKPEKGKEATLTQIFIITVMGSILFLILAFVLFAAGIFFLIRIAILMLLMMLAPLAFMGMILPKTQGNAKQWWEQLFCQSFFAPVYLFLLYLVIKIVSSGFLLNDLNTMNTETFSGALGSPTGDNVKLILNFAILIILTIATLTVSKKMGCQVGSFVQEWGKTLKKKAQGYAGKVIKRGGQRAVGAAAEGMLKNEKVMAIANRIPLATRGLARASSWQEKQKIEKKKEYEKTYKGYSDAGLAAMAKREKFGATEIGLETVGQGPRLTEPKMKVIQELVKKKEQDAKKKALKAERTEFDETRMKQIEEELKKAGEIESGKTKNREEAMEDELIKLEAKINGLQGDNSDQAKEERIEFFIQKHKLQKSLKNLEKLRNEKETIKDRQEQRIEREELGSKIAEIDKKAGAKPEEKKEEKKAA
ncbi:MAG: hypothetical protein ABIJ28_04170 [Patescibacteria group bacterium]